MENTVTVDSTVVRNDRGIVGQLSASGKIKKMHRASASYNNMSLKAYVSLLSEDHTPLVREWQLNKRGALNNKRSNSTIARIFAQNTARKNMRAAKKNK